MVLLCGPGRGLALGLASADNVLDAEQRARCRISTDGLLKQFGIVATYKNVVDDVLG